MPSRTSANKRRKLAAAAQEREDMPTIGIKDEQELALETLLFGGDNLDELLGTGKKEADVEDQVVEEKEEEAVEEINYGFVIDTVGSTQGPTSPIIEEKSGGAAWIDEETEKISVNIASSSSRLRKLRATEDEKNISGQEYESRLRKQFEKINPIPSWAAATEENDDDDDGLSFLKSSGTNRSHQTPFTCDALDIQRLADANKAEPCQSVVTSVQFHPTAPILSTSGLDKTLRLFQIDGVDNQKLASAHFADLPINMASFSGDKVICTGKRPYFYTYSLETGVVDRIGHIRGREEINLSQHYISPDNKYILLIGKDGAINMLDQKNMQWIATLKMNSQCCDLTFSKDGRFVYSFGRDGDVYQWDMESRTCMDKFFDQGAVKPKSISASPDDSYLATGTGVVNLYELPGCMSKTNPNPIKSIMNLTTAVDQIIFHPSSMLMAMASRNKKDALKMVHVPSKQVFSNWPTDKTPLGYVQCLSFSPGGGYFSVGNDKGKALLYKLKHFEEY